MINVNEVNRSLTEQLEATTKVYTTLETFTEHLRVCALVKIVKD